jgi:alkylmercury lyase
MGATFWKHGDVADAQPDTIRDGAPTGLRNDACCEADDGLLRGGLSEVAAALARAGFAALWRGRALTPAQLLPGNIEQALEGAAMLVAQGRAEVDDAGRVLGVHGLTLRNTRHRFDVAGRPRNTWCAFDSVGIPAALRLDAVVRTDCPTCGAGVTVEIGAGTPRDSDAVLWLPRPPATNLLAEFCSSADLFCNVDHLHGRIDAGRVPGRVCDLAAAAALGRTAWADVVDVVDTNR